MGPIRQNLVRHIVQDRRSNHIWLHDCLRVFLHNEVEQTGPTASTNDNRKLLLYVIKMKSLLISSFSPFYCAEFAEYLQCAQVGFYYFSSILPGSRAHRTLL